MIIIVITHWQLDKDVIVGLKSCKVQNCNVQLGEKLMIDLSTAMNKSKPCNNDSINCYRIKWKYLYVQLAIEKKHVHDVSNDDQPYQKDGESRCERT